MIFIEHSFDIIWIAGMVDLAEGRCGRTRNVPFLTP